MKGISNSSRASLLILGDILVYLFALILTLAIRYGDLPTRSLLTIHLPSFSILFVVFLVISFSAGLFDKQSSFMRRGLTSLLFKVQVINIFIGIAFFYLAPTGIAPKANLAIYFVVSTILLFLWRVIMFPVLSVSKVQAAILVGDGPDIKDLYEEVNGNARYGLYFKELISPKGSMQEIAETISAAVKRHESLVVVANLGNPMMNAAMPLFYSMIFSGVNIMNARNLYESIFDRIPLSMVGERWLVENAGGALGGRRMYDSLKRVMDIVIAALGVIVTLIFYPFVYAAIKIEDGGPLFIRQERIGKNGRPISIIKFRSMTANDNGAYATNEGKTKLQVTRVGKFIRMTRIDEFPQFWNILKGDVSLIGPRPEFPSLVNVYEKEIPYYGVRHLIKPGLSGWAQIYHRAHPHHAVAVDDTRDKLSYDMFYIKNRSLGLDLRIALQTAKALLSKQGV